MKYLLAVLLLIPSFLNAQWSSIANNQCVSVTDVINSGLYVNAAGAVVGPSNGILYKTSAIQKFALNPTNSGFYAKASNQLLSKEDLTPANTAFTVTYNTAGNGFTSNTDACSTGPSNYSAGLNWSTHLCTSYNTIVYFATDVPALTSGLWYYNNATSDAFKVLTDGSGLFYISQIGCGTVTVSCTVSFYVDASGNYKVEANVVSGTLPNTAITVTGALSDPLEGNVATDYSITIDANTNNKIQTVGALPSNPLQRNCTFLIKSFSPSANEGQTYSWTSVDKY